jgi:hypothetical protein
MKVFRYLAMVVALTIPAAALAAHVTADACDASCCPQCPHCPHCPLCAHAAR